MAAVDGAVKDLQQKFQLAAAAAVVFNKKRRVAANLAQPGQDGEDLYLTAVKAVFLYFILKILLRLQEVSQVKLMLFSRHGAGHFILRFGRQFLEDFFFQPA